jgi:hypothetical protein
MHHPKIKLDLQELGWWGMGWIIVAQGRDRWGAVVIAMMSLRVHKLRGISLLSEDVLAAQEGLISV